MFSAFFRQGQVLETFRGKGIYQPAVDAAIVKLNEGRWVSAERPMLSARGLKACTDEHDE